MNSDKMVNAKLNEWEKLIGKKQSLADEESRFIGTIRDSMFQSVIMFIDMANSTAYKTQYRDCPEVWIYHITRFYTFLTQILHENKAIILKYIGDEVMCMIEGDDMFEKADCLIEKLSNFDREFFESTGSIIETKVGVDFGSGYLVKLGDTQLDILGTPADRCARIGKLCLPGTILTSRYFVSRCSDAGNWHYLGDENLKGLDCEEIYQYKIKSVPLSFNADLIITTQPGKKTVVGREVIGGTSGCIIECLKSEDGSWIILSDDSKLEKRRERFRELIIKNDESIQWKVENRYCDIVCRGGKLMISSPEKKIIVRTVQ